MSEKDAALQRAVSAKDRVIASARKLFVEKGFHGTAVADLAEEAQVSVGTIYRLFSGKSEVIRAIVSADAEEMLEELQSVIDQVRAGEMSAEAAITRLVQGWVSVRIDALDHEMVAEAHRNAEIGDLITSVCSQLRDRFRLLIRLIVPEQNEVETEGAAELLLACQFGMGNSPFTRPSLAPAETAVIVTTLLLRAIRA